MKKWLIAVVSVLVLLAVVVSVAMWNANGNLIDLIAGQSQPEPKTLQTDISFKGAEAGQTYTAQVSVDTGVPVNIVSKEYISFAIDSSQVVGGKWSGLQFQPATARHNGTGAGPGLPAHRRLRGRQDLLRNAGHIWFPAQCATRV
ncbi:MAG: hypothetical protein NTV42_09460 [Chloroflexi bacterium]|nr:hypothetical protein [Chloroflexota bacterium]